MTEKFLICIDLDGTLLRDDKTISEETKKYLRFLETQGHYVCLTSGRPTYNVKKYYDEIGLKSSPIISFNGHLAKNTDKNIEYLSHYFSKEEVLSLYETLRANNLGSTFLVMNENKIFVTKKDDFLLTFYSSNETEINISENFENIFNIDSVLNIVFSLNSFDDKERTIKLINDSFPNYDPRFWGDYPFSEIYKKGVSKSNSIDELAAVLNIKSDHIIVFGDAQNDYEMIKNHPNNYVMKNGLDRLKNIAKNVTEFDNNNDGVLFELKKIFS